MAQYRVTDSELTGIADVIRLKGGTSEPLVFPSGFASAVEAIETQGTYISKVISANGEYDPSDDNADAFSHVTVSVPTSAPPVLVSKSISQNGTYNPADDNADAYSQVVVNVSGGGGDGLPEDLIDGNVSSFEFVNSTITSIRVSAFYRNSALSGVRMNALKIEDNVFNGCKKLQNAIFPNVEIIGSNAFYYCTSLANISFPNCEVIGSQCFYGDSSLLTASLPKCSLIAQSAFQSCTALKEIYLTSCNSINNSAFNNCRSLESVYLLTSEVCSLGTGVFFNSPYNASSWIGKFGSIFVPQSLVSEYKSARNWSAFSDRITAYVEG